MIDVVQAQAGNVTKWRSYVCVDCKMQVESTGRRGRLALRCHACKNKRQVENMRRIREAMKNKPEVEQHESSDRIEP